FEPDLERFPCLKLAYEALGEGGTAPAAMSAANEVAVASFLARKIRFMDIPRIIAETLDSHDTCPANSLEAVLDADRWARDFAASRIETGLTSPAAR
ncbi:MAG TPA: 1-deoxy-D-xylulose-5-phosphate reductoisomerase, partial [Blastocatellia bacterium]|nr:1-deoxy-D-xylulose-5-phosphate reductoisomerase [Blastocatellia bacterium]